MARTQAALGESGDVGAAVPEHHPAGAVLIEEGAQKALPGAAALLGEVGQGAREGVQGRG
jgi:hypothetical protein